MRGSDDAGKEMVVSDMDHKTALVQVWVEVDEGIADLVVYLNTISGVRTIASCQGTIGDGGPNPYPAHVMCHWTLEALERLCQEFDVAPLGEGWGYVCPKGALAGLTVHQDQVTGAIAWGRV